MERSFQIHKRMTQVFHTCKNLYTIPKHKALWEKSGQNAGNATNPKMSVKTNREIKKCFFRYQKWICFRSCKRDSRTHPHPPSPNFLKSLTHTQKVNISYLLWHSVRSFRDHSWIVLRLLSDASLSQVQSVLGPL